eukprot:UN01496
MMLKELYTQRYSISIFTPRRLRHSFFRLFRYICIRSVLCSSNRAFSNHTDSSLGLSPNNFIASSSRSFFRCS